MLGTEGQESEAVRWVLGLFTTLVGIITLILGAILRRLYMTKAERSELNALAESIKQLRIDKDRSHSDLKEMLYRMHAENKDAIRAQAASNVDLQATIRLLTQQLMQIAK